MDMIVFNVLLFVMYITGIVLNLVITLDILVYTYDGKCNNIIFSRYDNGFKTFYTYLLDVLMLIALILLSFIGTVFLLNIIWNIEDNINS